MADGAPGNNGNSGGDGGSGSGTGSQGTGSGDGQGGSGSSQGGSQFDPAALSQEQINQILEKNPHVWKTERLSELRNKGKKYDEAQTAAEAAETKRLEDEGKFKELSEKQASEIEALRKGQQSSSINQALTVKLAGGVVDLEAALTLVDKTNVTIDDNGTVQGVDQAIEALKSSKPYLFGNGSQSSSVGNPTNVGNGNEGATVKFKRSQLRDSKFYNANKEAIQKAALAGNIEDDIS